MPNYDKTIIYKIVNYDFPHLVYVGSTTNFTKRKQHHKERCINPNSKKHHLKIYVAMREHGGWENWNMIKICDFPCKNKREAEQEEDRYMIELKSTLHMRRPFQTPETRQEYFDNRKEIKKEYDIQRRATKGEEIKQKKREAYYRDKEKNSEKITCECGRMCKKSYLKTHQKTTRHQELMKQINSIK